MSPPGGTEAQGREESVYKEDSAVLCPSLSSAWDREVASNRFSLVVTIVW